MNPSSEFNGLAEALRECSGWNVMMWFYTVTHSELVLQLRHPDVYRVKFLVLSGCSDICVPAEGALNGVRVAQLSELNWEVSLFDGFRVHAEAWRLTDDYKILPH